MPPACSLASASSHTAMSQRRPSSPLTLASPHGAANLPEGFDHLQPQQADKEFYAEGNFFPIECSRYKYSVDHSAAENLSPTISPTRHDKELNPDGAVAGMPEAVPPRIELPGDHPPHREDIIGEIESISMVPFWKRKRFWAAVVVIVLSQ